ncbi:methyl-accepting chemotaxis protein [Azospirillum sp. sgz302134]
MVGARATSIASRVYALVGLLAMVAVAIAMLAWYALSVYQTKVARIEAASESAIVGERVNAAVLSVVMDSRGIYLAETRAETEPFAKPLLAGLERMRTLLERWDRLTPADQRAEFSQVKEHAGQFIAVRARLVDLGRSEGPPAARAYGDNDANRANRQALNRAIEALAERNNRYIDTVVQDLDDFYARMRLAFSALAAVGILAVVALAWVVVRRSITGPLQAITDVIARLAQGELGLTIPGVDKRDEIGALARAAEVFKRNGEEMQRLQADAARTREEAERTRKADMERLAARFEQAVQSVVETVASSATQLRASASALSETTSETSQRAASAASATEQTSASVQTVAAATEEMAASVREIARQVSDSSRIATSATAQARETDATVASLADSATRIGEVVDLIQSIASQTNLLALNATIEAARAGEAGKGFAVVAQEVKSLANQTAKATEDISAQITAMQTAASSAVQAIQAIGETIGTIHEISGTIASAVDQQGAATNEISRNVQEAAVGSQRASTDVSEVSHATATAGAAAEQVLSAAGALNEQADSLRREVRNFLSGIRAA